MSRRPSDRDTRASHDRPLLRRFPALASIPRVSLGEYPTPIESLESLAPGLWIKRDDLSGATMGGNKTRALEFLLGDVTAGTRLVTVGSAGSTHALAVATHGERLGADVRIARWRQEMNPSADRVARKLSSMNNPSPVFRTPLGAYWWAMRQRMRGARWIAAGGSTALGVLGHVNAGLELIDQIHAGAFPQPAAVVVPLGTGGTAAGLALAFAIAACPITVIGARVVSRVVARKSRVRHLAGLTAALIERMTGDLVPSVRSDRIDIEHSTWAGAYGRDTAGAREAALRLQNATGVELDATYSAKAFELALGLTHAARGPTLYWLTFDSRILDAP
ncbi:MAG: 1-aminocyclopropane-1-carboxylate deaminase/D-cysteine desulfhydrase [Gemmatimonadaceae bacterium]